MPRRELVVMPREDSGDSLSGRADLVGRLAGFNTAPERPGDDVLYGPGIRIDLPPEQDPVGQLLLTVVDEDIAFSVIRRILGEFPWRILDPISGMEWVGRPDAGSES